MFIDTQLRNLMLYVSESHLWNVSMCLEYEGIQKDKGMICAKGRFIIERLERKSAETCKN